MAKDPGRLGGHRSAAESDKHRLPAPQYSQGQSVWLSSRNIPLRCESLQTVPSLPGSLHNCPRLYEDPSHLSCVPDKAGGCLSALSPPPDPPHPPGSLMTTQHSRSWTITWLNVSTTGTTLTSPKGHLEVTVEGEVLLGSLSCVLSPPVCHCLFVGRIGGRDSWLRRGCLPGLPRLLLLASSPPLQSSLQLSLVQLGSLPLRHQPHANQAVTPTAGQTLICDFYSLK
ncbi:hypothetical protein L3Q82_019177, partial [Scortum barcoo]